MSNEIFNFFQSCIVKMSGHGIGKIYPISAIYSQLDSFMYQTFHNKKVAINGNIFNLDNSDSLALAHDGFFETFEMDFFMSLLKPGQVVVDLGANIGFYTLPAAQIVGNQGQVYAFEPSPTNVKLLNQNIKWNDYRNVTIIHKAVSNINGTLKFELCPNGAENRIAQSDSKNIIEVECITLDSMLYNVKVDVVKMDIEGACLLALSGMKGILQNNPQIQIIMEFCPAHIKRMGLEPVDVLSFVVDRGFKLYNINDKTKQIEPTSTTELLKIPARGTEHTNIYLKR